MRKIGTAYALALVQFVLPFAAGLHRFYLGKPITGLLWMFTYGLLGIGTIYDLITLPGQVEEYNRKALKGARRQKALPQAPQRPLKDRVVALAGRKQGRLTTMAAAAELRVSLEKAEEALDDLVRHGHADMEVTDDGVVVYNFPELRV